MARRNHVEGDCSTKLTPVVWDVAARAAADRLKPSTQDQVLDRLSEIADLLKAIEKNTRRGGRGI